MLHCKAASAENTNTSETLLNIIYSLLTDYLAFIVVTTITPARANCHAELRRSTVKFSIKFVRINAGIKRVLTSFEIELVALEGSLHTFITTKPAPISKNRNEI